MDNINYVLYLCVVIPMAFMLFLVKGKSRMPVVFMMTGISVCLFVSEINGLLLQYFHGDMFYVTTTITPMTEELIKALPILYFALVFSDSLEDLITASMAAGVGFAVLENLIILVGNIESVTMLWAFLRGVASGLMHVMMGIMIGADVVLDYLLMFVFPFGIRGAAFASLISLILSAGYGFFRLHAGKGNYQIKIKPSKINIRQMVDICRIGSPAAIGNSVDALKLIGINAIVLSSGGQKAAAIWAVLNSLSEFSRCITVGVSYAAKPMMGVYYSAKENSGLRILMGLQVRTGMFLSAFYTVFLVVFSGMIGSVFAIGADIRIPLLCLGLFVGLDVLGNIWTNFLGVTEKVALADFIVLNRNLILPVFIIYLISRTSLCLWLFLPLSALAVLFFCHFAAGVMCWKKKNTQRPLSRFLLLDDYLEREKKVLDFSLEPTEENICEASDKIDDFCHKNDMDQAVIMRLQLSIEELLMAISAKNRKLGSVDLRVFCVDGSAGIRIRCAGVCYNPFELEDEDNDNEEMMGVMMMKKMANAVTHTYTLGMNVINILFDYEKENDKDGDEYGEE